MTAAIHAMPGIRTLTGRSFSRLAALRLAQHARVFCPLVSVIVAVVVRLLYTYNVDDGGQNWSLLVD
ncbi:hypothetical protein EJ05DRAFT_474028 [Pseudovirgaria hyperparasitica]|uniref:Uncharacterized protein n=1 Tax=Pseudovirgaria hyperparasitica TaxID=470096 RepID=A0A6A6WG56_9PEZI|nr:uncharacterized protein EJ05DRAFT_474028 [Pseudovirgaria hyperparasitica]KAF2760121.1 hypothetical protein EJ05DRAFT_474028 [Pseudovirgaria hyperparasitica]